VTAGRETRARVVVRDAIEEDLDTIARIKVTSWAETYRHLLPAETLNRFLDLNVQRDELRGKLAHEHNLLLVAVRDGRVQGFALAFLDERPDPWLESLHVARDERGNGIGTLLMRQVAGRVSNRGFSTLRLGVVSGNDGAGRLYRRLGADMIGEEPAHWAPDVTHELYRWTNLAPLLG
jgi:ribosomal protein S18 acetylase RimI-like enzyme